MWKEYRSFNFVGFLMVIILEQGIRSNEYDLKYVKSSDQHKEIEKSSKKKMRTHEVGRNPFRWRLRTLVKKEWNSVDPPSLGSR